MKITYIHHSGFSVELDSCILLFDYFQGNIPYFDKNKKLYVFSSHSHHDHFNKSIFKMEETHPDVTYILSNDINAPKSENIKLMGSNERLLIDDLRVETLESSDLGVAFIVRVENKTIYHAGDLNWWHWEGELSDEENKAMGDKYKHEINKIKGMTFDLAFIPLDSRQGLQYYLGFDTFMKNTNTKAAFPMHIWKTYRVIDMLINSEHAVEYKDRIFKISKDNEEFIINETH